MFKDLVGKTLVKVDVNKDEDEIRFETSDGCKYLMQHYQDCCEQVYVEDINGDLEDIIGSVILVAEVSISNKENTRDALDVWVFYKIDTAKGGVTIRWNGSSNGYYSVDVDFSKV